MASDLNPDILETVLMHLPGLTGLHVLGSPKVDHIVLLKLLVHTPQLESLSFTAYVSTFLSVDPISPLTLDPGIQARTEVHGALLDQPPQSINRCPLQAYCHNEHRPLILHTSIPPPIVTSPHIIRNESIRPTNACP